VETAELKLGNIYKTFNENKQKKILGFHGGDYEEWCLLGCYTVWLL
jgi:hypothetical protein